MANITKQNLIKKQFWLDQAQTKALEKLARKAKISQSRIIRNILADYLAK